MKKGIYILFLVLLAGIVASKTYMPTNIMIRSIPNGTNTSFSINGSPACTPGNGLCNVTNRTLGKFGNNTYIKKDGTTTTTARIPFDLGIDTGSITHGSNIVMQPDSTIGKSAYYTTIIGGNRNDGPGANLFLDGGTGLASDGIVCVGVTCTSSHSLIDSQDLMVEGSVEIDGNTYFDDSGIFVTNKGIYFRSTTQYILSPSNDDLDIYTGGGTITLGGSAEVVIASPSTLNNAVTPLKRAYIEELYATGYSEFGDEVDFTQGPVSISGGGVFSVQGLSTFYGGLLLPDNAKANFGTGNDYHISFDGDKKLWLNASSTNSQIRVASNMVVQQKKNITLLNNTNLNLQAKYSGGGFPSYKRYDASEINWLIGNDNQESGNDKFVSLYADEASATNRGYNIVSQQGIYLSANSGTGTISLNGKVNFADGLQLSFGTGVGGTSDFYQYYSASAQSMIFDSNNGIGYNALGWVINENGRDRDVRMESDNDANMFVINGSVDKLGIGTSNPNEKLTVIGNLNITGNINVSGNINVQGCICYDGGTCLGTCK